MIRIAALNDSNSGSDSEDCKESSEAPRLTKEAVENAAYSLYNKGLGYERAGSIKQAIQSFELLLNNDFIKQPVVPCEDGQQQPSSLLKYSALKNLAKLHSQEGRHREAIEALLQAIEIDFTDVSVCYRLGVLARKLDKFVLASKAFQKGLELSADHWPCLDNLLTLLYALNNYEACLFHIADSLVRDSGYVKALVLRKLIYKEQPCLEKEYSAVFSKCDMEQVLAYTDSLEPQEEDEVLEEVIAIRDTYSDLCKPKSPPTIHLDLPKLSWLSLGKRLLKLYTDIEEKSPEQNHCSLITMNTKLTGSSTDKVTVDRAVGSDNVQEFSSKEANELSSMTAEVKQGSDSSQCTLSALSASSTDNSLSNHICTIARTSGSLCEKPDRDDLVILVLNEMIEKVEELTAGGSAVSDDVEAVKGVLEHILSTVDDMTPSDLQVQHVVSDMVSQVVDDVDNDPVLAVQGVIDLLVSQVLASETARDKSPSPIDVDHVYAIASGSETHAERGKTKKSRVASEHKRRSTRVKPPTGKQTAAETLTNLTNYASELEDAVPRALLEEPTSERGEDLMDTSANTLQPTSTAVTAIPFEDEATDVQNFLSRLQTNMGVIHVIREWLYSLTEMRMYTWSPDLISTYMKVYEVHRPCYQMPNVFSSNPVERDAMSTLMWMEFKVDSVNTKSGGKVNIGRDFEKEFTYWEYAIGCVHRLPDVCKEYSIRYYHMASLYFSANKQLDDSVLALRNLLDYMDSLPDPDMRVVLPNTVARTVLTREKIEGDLKVLDRARSLSQLQNVYDSENFDQVLSLLTPTFELPLSKRYTDSRIFQLKLLLDTISKLKDFKQPIKWLADVLQEIVHHADSGHAGSWTDLTVSALTLIDSKMDAVAMDDVSLVSRVQLAKSCLAIIRVNVAAIELGKVMPVKSVLAWIILSKLVRMHESSEATDITDSPSNSLPQWLELLVQSHKFLAKYSQCTCFKGALLQFMVKCLLRLLSVPGCNNRQQLEKHFNQCVFCLYAHPNKKIKAKHLNDHGSPTIPLTWSVAQQLFDYYKPKSLPDFDSYKSSTISAELEHLLKRLVGLVPAEHQPDALLVNTVDSYLTESASLKDLDELRIQPSNPMCSAAFYLLADYYLKNKEPLKATKHYTQDLYYQPNRFDSWAGMALAKSSKLESRLGLMERQSYDGAFQKLAVSTVQSFNRALQLNHDNVKLWIEYACTAYQLHSFASRVMKSRKSELPHPDMATFVQLRKDMLAKSQHCFMEASLCNDDNFEEEWLHHYMLGKIGEKLQEEPSVYLKHYIKAAKCLDREGAQYPSKISYMYNPPYLAVEALEMYYRVHASILKSIQRNETSSHYQLFSEVLSEMKTSPFASAQMSSPCTPVSRKRKPAPDSVERPSGIRRRKSESELSSPAPPVKIATRRREKLRVDKELVKELLDEMVSGLVSLKYPSDKERSDLLASQPDVRSAEGHVSEGDSSTAVEVTDSEVSLIDEQTERKLKADVKYAVVSLVDLVEEQLKLGTGCFISTSATDNPSVLSHGTETSVTKTAGDQSQGTMTTESTSICSNSSAVEFEGQQAAIDLSYKRKLEESLMDADVSYATGTAGDASWRAKAEQASTDLTVAESIFKETKECMDDMLDHLSVDNQHVLHGSPSLTISSHSDRHTPPVIASMNNSPLSKSSHESFSASSLSLKGAESSMVTDAVSAVSESVLTASSSNSQSGVDEGGDTASELEADQLLDDTTADDVGDIVADVSEAKDTSSSQPSDMDVTLEQTSQTTSQTSMDSAVGGPEHDIDGDIDDTSASSPPPIPTDTIDLSTRSMDTPTMPCVTVTSITFSTAISSIAPSVDAMPLPPGSALSVSAPSVCAPSGSAPSESSPSVSAPSVSATSGSASSGSAPSGSAPSGSAPSGSALSLSAPSGSAPSGSTPSRSAPSGSAPVVVSPVVALSKDELTEACISALKLCVQRYPLHYKSYFRLAKTFLHDSQRKDLDKVQDLLLGNTSKKHEDKFVPQGLFQDRKHNNFFNGVWRIPVEEIERAGSFGAHLYKTIYLLLQFLHEKRDYHLLYQLHSQLQRTPDIEKKFLKDVDRLLLASKAMEFAIHSLYKVIGADASSKAEYNYAASLHQSYKWFNYCNKNSICVPNAQVLLIKAYKSYKRTVDEMFDVHSKICVAEAKEFCQHLFSNRSKDKAKSTAAAADPRQPAGESAKLQVTLLSTATAKTSKGSPTTALPPVRGSFPSSDSKKTKITASKLDLTSPSTTLASEKPSKQPVDLPSSSWMNKAKEGTAALASMFIKPKSS